MNKNMEFCLEMRNLRMVRDHANAPSIPYSVAEHQYFLALYILAYEQELAKANALMLKRVEGHTRGMYIHEFLRCALMHDIGEIWTGDIPYPMKKTINQEALELAERELIGYNVYERYGRLEQFNRNMEHYSDLGEEFHPLFKLMDMFEYGVHKYYELLRGDQTTLPILANVYNCMVDMLVDMKLVSTELCFIDDLFEAVKGRL